jgi:hypothetical protein
MGGSNSSTAKAAFGRNGAKPAGKAIISKAFTKAGAQKAGVSKKSLAAAKQVLSAFRTGRAVRTATKKAKKAATITRQLQAARAAGLGANAARQAANRRERSGD